MAPVSVSEAVNGETSIRLRIKLLIFLVTGLDSAVFMYLQIDRMLWKKSWHLTAYYLHYGFFIICIQMWGGITRHAGRLQANCFAEHNSNIGIFVFRAGVFFFLCAIKAMNISFSKQIYPLCSYDYVQPLACLTSENVILELGCQTHLSYSAVRPQVGQTIKIMTYK